MRTTLVFFAGVIASILVAAAAFRGGTPVDYTFTYQGQLRSAGTLVNGPVDLRITLWDSDVAGGQVGATNNYQAVPIADGRFALGLNFGATAFDGSNRWVQLEFRSPAGVGQYLTLNPRDKITATPYAMFALNGGNGIWNYNPESQSVSVLGQKVGIGTSTPTAALEVVGTGGDDAVKLPAGSVGKTELAPSATSRGLGLSITVQPGGDVIKAFTVSESCQLIVNVVCVLPYYQAGTIAVLLAEVDGISIPLVGISSPNGQHGLSVGTACIPLAVGDHTVRLVATSDAWYGSGRAALTAFTVPGQLD